MISFFFEINILQNNSTIDTPFIWDGMMAWERSVQVGLWMEIFTRFGGNRPFLKCTRCIIIIYNYERLYLLIVLNRPILLFKHVVYQVRVLPTLGYQELMEPLWLVLEECLRIRVIDWIILNHIITIIVFLLFTAVSLTSR